MFSHHQPQEVADPLAWMDQYGDSLFGYALSRVHDRATAEDLVQETLLAGLKGRQGFQGSASVKTWLFGILKHKVIDHFRQAGRWVTAGEETTEEEFFDQSGHWRPETAPANWHATPDRLLEGKELGREIEMALARLPEPLATVFILREIEGRESGEICRILNISSANYWVRLHRARLRLRDSVERSWLARSPSVTARSVAAVVV